MGYCLDVAIYFAHNVEAMTSKGLRSDALSTDEKLDTIYKASLTTKTALFYDRLLYAVIHCEKKYFHFFIENVCRIKIALYI